MAKDKHLPPPPQKNRENSSTDKTSELGTFNDLEWDLIDEVDFGHKKFIKVALINKAYASTCDWNSAGGVMSKGPSPPPIGPGHTTAC